MLQTVEKLSDTVTRREDTDLSVVIFEILDSNRSSVDVYIDSNLETLRNWDKTKPLYLIQDISNKAVALTPYLKERLNEIMAYIKDNQMQVRTALVIPNDFNGRVAQMFGRLFTANGHYMKQSYFTDIASARNWIISQQKKA